MQRLILRWAINAVALYVAVGTGWVPGIHPQDTSWLAILGMGLIFSLANALVRPLLKFVTCPVILLTLGLFTLVINAAMFWLTGWIGQQFNIGFTFDDPWYWYAFLGSLVVGVVSAVLTLILRDELKPRRR
ncbi:MAG: phage holin family protein [Chloroflexota bacterium]